MMRVFLLLAMVAMALSGCDIDIQQSNKTNPIEPAPSQRKIVREKNDIAEPAEVLKAVEKLIEADNDRQAPDSVVELPEVDGWKKSEARPLADDGLSVAYDHESGLTVTLYQYTRGLPKIPNAVDSACVAKEFANSRDGMAQAVKMGLYDSLELKGEGIVDLGSSDTKVLWASYIAERGGMRSATDIMIWSCKDHFFKIRLSSTPRRSKSKKARLDELFTALGTALDPHRE